MLGLIGAGMGALGGLSSLFGSKKRVRRAKKDRDAGIAELQQGKENASRTAGRNFRRSAEGMAMRGVSGSSMGAEENADIQRDFDQYQASADRGQAGIMSKYNDFKSGEQMDGLSSLANMGANTLYGLDSIGAFGGGGPDGDGVGAGRAGMGSARSAALDRWVKGYKGKGLG